MNRRPSTAIVCAAALALSMFALPTRTARAQSATVPVIPTRDSTGASPRILFERGLKLDGLLTELAWLRTDSLTTFTQRDPRQGEAVTERTVVRFVGSPEGLWIGVWAFDREPQGIRRTQLRRDADFGADDHVSVMLSPTADKRTAFLFSINPNGALNDAEVLNFEGESREWDGIWDGRARITGDGWQAEILIPWQTLRYRPVDADAAADAWDINVRRYIRRKNESALWTAWKRTEGIRFLERAGSLIGFKEAKQVLEAGLPRRAIAEFRPYVVTTGALTERTVLDDGSLAATRARGLRGTAGLDAKLAPAPTLTLDLTANADFAQAEVDRQVVNLSRFSLFFPEQRPFFTEGAGIFDFGRRGETQLFYSRRVGLGADGAPIPLQGGARLTGRLGAQQVGLLTTHTGGNEPATAVVGRVKRDILGRGYVGAMATMNAPRGGPGSGAGGVDINLPYVIRDQNLVLLATAAMDGGATVGDPYYMRGIVDFPNDVADIALRIDRIGAGFNPDLGFVQQRGVVRTSWNTELTPRPDALGAVGRPFTAMHVRQFKFDVLSGNLVRTMGATGPLTGLSNGSISTSPLGLEFESGDEISIEFKREFDAPTEAFDLFDGAEVEAGRYAWNSTELQFQSSSARTIGVDASVARGGFYTGRSTELSASLRGRFAPHINVSLDYNRTAASLALPDSTVRFTAQTARVRLDVATSPRLSTTLFAQWDNESNRGAVNARVRWTSSPGSDLYVVWTSQWPTDLARGIPWRTPTRGTLVAKYVRYFRV
ncbi:MAG: carbohydrate binding family 9 domain-containing protein [Gemmatimonadaceae bacterium]|nr:carbohydrate binding family 9 domain-containing protein [Gemmatimonadaceae bacterium]